MVSQNGYFSSVDGCSSSSLNLADRGLAYGDGLFETMRLHAGEIVLLERHLQRLLSGCSRLFIPISELKVREYIALLLAGTQACEDYGILKLIVTRGQGGAGYSPPEYEKTEAPIILQLTLKSPDYFNDSTLVSLHPCLQTLSSNSTLAGIKHLNRLEYVLAARELNQYPGKQALLLDENGCVIETLHHNLFLVKGGRLLTPKLSHCGVAGVMRGLIVDVLAPALIPKMKLCEVELTMEDVYQAEEVFLSNSVRGIVGVSSVNQSEWHRHSVAQQLSKKLNNIWGGINGGC